MEANRFLTKKNKFNAEALQKHEGISRTILVGDSPKNLGAISITANFDTWPCNKKDWSNDVSVCMRTLAKTNSSWDDDEDKIINTRMVFSLESINNLIANLVEVRDELVALDNEVCEAFDIVDGNEDDD